MTGPSTSTGVTAGTAIIASIRRFIRAAVPPAALALTLLAASACGSGSGADAPPSPINTATPSPRATASPPVPTEPPPASFETERAMDHIRVLAQEIGVRNAGSDNERRAAEYIRDQLASYGYEAVLQPFTFPNYVDLQSDVDILSPENRTISAYGLQPSPDGVLEAELVHAGRGHAQEFPSGTAGRIALAERGDIPFSEKAANAYLAGAAGLIIYNNEPGEFYGQLSQAARIPVMAISREDGQQLLEDLAEGPVTARIRLETAKVDVESWNVVARDQGRSCRIVAGGHLDSVPAGPGANDNASGTATVLELARVRAADGVPEDICYVLFGAEEAGLLGSAHYVSTLSESERSAMRAMLNFDMLAVGQGWPLLGSEDMIRIAVAQAERLGLDYRLTDELPDNAGSDHANFARAGIPTLFFNCFCDANWHTPADRIEAIQPVRIKQAGDLGLAVIGALLAEDPPR